MGPHRLRRFLRHRTGLRHLSRMESSKSRPDRSPAIRVEISHQQTRVLPQPGKHPSFSILPSCSESMLQALNNSITSSCGQCSRPLHDLLILEIHRVGPAEPDYILLVTGADVNLGIARDHIVLLADGAIFCESLVDGGVEMLR